MIGRILCAVGFHRWEFKDERWGNTLVTFSRCTRRCIGYDEWRAVNRDQIRRPW